MFYQILSLIARAFLLSVHSLTTHACLYIAHTYVSFTQLNYLSDPSCLGMSNWN